MSASMHEALVEAPIVRHARDLSTQLATTNGPRNGKFIRRSSKELRRIASALAVFARQPLPGVINSDNRAEELISFAGVAETVQEGLACFLQIPSVIFRGELLPRVVAIAESYLDAVEYRFSKESCVLFVRILQDSITLLPSELAALNRALQLGLFLALGEVLWAAPFRYESAKPLAASLRGLAGLDEDAMVASLVSFECLLESDPAGIYRRQDARSKDDYRRAVERLAIQHSLPPEIVCQTALSLASREPVTPDLRLRLRSHIGYYLLGDGVHFLLERHGIRAARAPRLCSAATLSLLQFLFLTAVLGLATCAMCLPGMQHLPQQAIVFLALHLAAIPCALFLMDIYRNRRPPNGYLPRIDLSSGIPFDFRTIVAIPAVLLDMQQVLSVVSAMERHYSLTAGYNVYFVLLTDFPDASTPEVEDRQKQVLDFCSVLITDLNERPAHIQRKPFFLLHRDRVFCETQGKWIGWERKRGKIQELVWDLRSGASRFSHSVGDMKRLAEIEYVVVIDEDTEITSNSIERLVGAHIHPLNHPHVDLLERSAAKGYGILQPGILEMTSAATKRKYKKERVSRDFCQEAFGETPFCGKGIINVEAFTARVAGALPEQRILSHDIVEGGLMRTGAVPDVLFCEATPSNYSVECCRQHRWIRGDWQNVFWLISAWCAGRCRMPLFGTFLIVQLACASLLPAAVTTLLLMGVLLHRSELMACLALLDQGPRILPIGIRAINARRCGRSVLQSLRNDFLKTGVRTIRLVAGSAHGTLLAMDAIVRTSIRWLIGRGLLEWNTFASSQRTRDRFTLLRLYEHEWLAAALAAVAILVAVRPVSTGLLCLLLSWSSRPAIQAAVKHWANQRDV